MSTYAEYYEKIYGSLNADFDDIRAFIAQCGDGPILDIGAGTGRTVGAVSNRQVDYVENSPDMCRLLEVKTRKIPSAGVIFSSCFELPVSPGKYAGAYMMFCSINEMFPVLFALRELYRVLKDDGLIYFLTTNPKVYQTSGFGLKRARKFGIDSLSFSVETLAQPHLGRGSYQTILRVNSEKSCEHFYIDQEMPSYEEWMSLIPAAGFIVEKTSAETHSIPFKEESSKFLGVTARKQAACPVSHKYENASAANMIYNAMAEKYDSVTSIGQYAIPAWIAKCSEEWKNSRPIVFDLACANGFIGRELKKNGILPTRLFGLDASSEMVKRCDLSGDYTASAVWDLSLGLPTWRGMQADLVTAFGLLEFIEKPDKLLADVFRTLAVGGELWISFEKSTGEHLVVTEMDVAGTKFVRYARSREKSDQLLLQSGFKIISCDVKEAYKSPTTGQSVSYLIYRATRDRL